MTHLINQLNSWGRQWLDFALPMLFQSSVLILVLLALDRLLIHRVRAVVRYGLWMLLPLKLLLPTSFSLPTGVGYWTGPAPPRPVEHPWVDAQRSTSLSLPAAKGFLVRRGSEPIQERLTPINPPPQQKWRPEQPSLTLAGILWSGWIIGGLILAGYILYRSLWVRRLVRLAAAAPPAWPELLQACSRQLKLKRPVGLKISSEAIGPAVCGLWRPTIVMPAQLAEQMSDTSLRAVFLHELAHIKRGDLWVNHLQSLLQVFYFYNPLLWLANAAIRRAREQAVDEMVLVALGEEAGVYPETLLAVAKLALFRAKPALGLVGIVENKRSLSQRLKLMVERPIPRSARLGITGLILVAMMGALLLPMARGQREISPLLTPAASQEPQVGLAEMLPATNTQDQILLDATRRKNAELLSAQTPAEHHQTGTSVHEIRVFRLKHADPVEIADLFSKLFPDPTQNTNNQSRLGGNETRANAPAAIRVIVAPDPRTSSVIVSASHDLMPKITEMVAQMDAAINKSQRLIVSSDSTNKHLAAVLQDLFDHPSNQWDIDHRITIINHSPLFPEFSIQDMFGAANSTRESGTTVFGDEGEPGFVHFVEWRTMVPVTIRSINLFAGGDGPEYAHEREFATFTLKVKSRGNTEYDKTLVSYTATHPYQYFDANTFLLISTNFPQITAQEFRAEFKQYKAGRGYDGPRILELAAFSDRVPPRESSRKFARVEHLSPGEQMTNVPGYEIKNIEVSNQGEYRLERQVMSLDQLDNALAKASDSGANLIVYLRASKTAKMESVTAVMECCQRHKITQIVVRLEPGN